MKRYLVAIMLACCSLVVWAGNSGEGDGTVLEVDRDGKSLLVQHGEIPGMMGPMTMQFLVDDVAMLDGLNESDVIHFTVEHRPPFDWVITKLQVTKHSPDGAK